MKKLLSLVMMLVIVLAVTPSVVQAQGLDKYAMKQVQKASKELVKQGWTIASGTIEQKMIQYEAGIANGDEGLIGESLGGKKYNNTAISDCINQALEMYLKSTGEGIIRERITSQVSDLSEEEANNLVDMSESNFIKEMKGELGVPVMVLTRRIPNTDKPFEARCYYLIKKERLSRALENAVKKSASEVDGAAEIGNKISDFIKGGSDE